MGTGRFLGTQEVSIIYHEILVWTLCSKREFCISVWGREVHIDVEDVKIFFILSEFPGGICSKILDHGTLAHN